MMSVFSIPFKIIIYSKHSRFGKLLSNLDDYFFSSICELNKWLKIFSLMPEYNESVSDTLVHAGKNVMYDTKLGRLISAAKLA